jgi:hypothetical protein
MDARRSSWLCHQELKCVSLAVALEAKALGESSIWMKQTTRKFAENKEMA